MCGGALRIGSYLSGDCPRSCDGCEDRVKSRDLTPLTACWSTRSREVLKGRSLQARRLTNLIRCRTRRSRWWSARRSGDWLLAPEPDAVGEGAEGRAEGAEGGAYSVVLEGRRGSLAGHWGSLYAAAGRLKRTRVPSGESASQIRPPWAS